MTPVGPLVPGTILFRGEAVATGTGSAARSFVAWASDSAPTVTGGYAKWLVIDRPQRTGLNVFQGYDPITLTVPIRFQRIAATGSWENDVDAGAAVEQDIAALEWMAGRGTGSTGAGPSPVVVVYSSDENGAPIPLIPFNYQITDANPTGPRFVVVGIDWDTSPDRNRHGYRVRQDATVSLQQHVTDPHLDSSSADRAQKTAVASTVIAATVTTTAAMDTILKVAAKHPGLHGTWHAARAILAVNPALRARSVSTKLRPNTRVQIPVSR